MYELSNVKGVIFDIDGTLLDSMSIWEDLCSRYLTSLNVTPSEDVDSIVANMSMIECADYAISRYNLDLDRDDFIAGIRKIIEKFYREEVALKPGAKELVDSIWQAGIPMVLVTTGDRKLAGCALVRCKIFDKFEALLTCNDYNTSKESAYIFELAEDIIDRFAVKGDVYVFEDSIVAIRTAKQAGYKVVGIRDNSGCKTFDEIMKTADITIDSLEEITLSEVNPEIMDPEIIAPEISADAKMEYICPCCRKHFFSCKASYEICPVCKWEDDPVARKDIMYEGGANKLCLKDYREEYLRKQAGGKHE